MIRPSEIQLLQQTHVPCFERLPHKKLKSKAMPSSAATHLLLSGWLGLLPVPGISSLSFLNPFATGFPLGPELEQAALAASLRRNPKP